MSVNYKPHIGKNVIETLTLGMYDDSRFIFREYIQNAADQIDVAVEENILDQHEDGFIEVNIDTTKKFIEVKDNATGIKSDQVLNFLGDVANSSKDKNLRKGFRGIGRLGGLGYCEKLEFETSYSGESKKSIISLDANLLRKLIADKDFKEDASAVISVITSIDYAEEILDSHFFKVKLHKVTNESLLDLDNVRSYLSMVAPLPFNDNFSFKDDIIRYFAKNNVAIESYNVEVNGTKIFKAYKDFLSEKDIDTPLIGVDFFRIYDEVELLGIGWYGFRGRVNNMLEARNIERGIRIRKSNIGIGNEDTLKRFFKEQRTNLRFIGELHVTSANLIPNARRDYFNDSKSTSVFNKQLKQIFSEEDWENRLAQTASKLHNRLKEIQDYQKSKDDFENQKAGLKTQKQHEKYLEDLDLKKQKAIRASNELSKISEKARKDKNVKKLYEHIVGEKELSVDDNIQIPSVKFDPPTFNKLNDEETKVVREIFKIIEDTLSANDSEKLKKKILDRYN